MIGLVLAAGHGKRLAPITAELPKTLVPVLNDLTLLDFILENLAAVGVSRVVVVAGHAAQALRDRIPRLRTRYGLEVETLLNDRFDLNNAYSLWLAREVFAEGALLINGDTLHPRSVEQCLLAQRGPGLLLAVDQVRRLTEEAMKVQLSSRLVTRITKQIDPLLADGEYIGAALIEPCAAADLVAALEETWQRDGQAYYEDGFQALIDHGGKISTVDIGEVEWVEVDDHEDLGRAREIACRY